MTKQPTFRQAGARRLEKSNAVSRFSKRLLLGAAASVGIIAVVIFSTLAFEPGLRGGEDASSLSEGSSRGSAALGATEATTTAVHVPSMDAQAAKPPSGEDMQAGQVEPGNGDSSQDPAAPALGPNNAREEVLAAARRSSTLDYGSLEAALEGKLSPELRMLVTRHKAESLAFARAERSYDDANAAHSVEVQAGKIDPATREALEAKARVLSARVDAIQKLNGEISARFQREVDARIASLSP